ncbi:cell division protein CrgA [Humibacter ginsenosidimutans]|uniref:Cell division protein CrgA n=1 Tax=Humibacter ginsenosidimutans TaxID=2599293 RepID=A0A5B8M6D5_9MICO|nr:cell division protein CrgA [Humibacter ginsenosidimutans]QDZ15554.1 cell division protein CrgA [Humibacter ginsenosidimutans]
MASKTRTKRSSRPDKDARSSEDAPNPVWFLPVMLGFMIVGLLWIVVFYVSGSQYPVPQLGAWNILIGFGIAFVGFLMTTRWR